MVRYISEGNGPRLLAVNISTLLVTWTFASLRIYVRLVLIKTWMPEDWLFVAAQITFSILNAISFGSMAHGNGQLLDVVRPGDLVIAMRYWYLTELLYIASVFLLRLSIGFLLLRICSQRRFVIPIWATIVSMTIITVFYFFFCIFQCQPISSFWLRFDGQAGTCLPSKSIQRATVAHSAVCFIADMVFGILPLFLIWSLQINIRAKISVSILLSLGIFAAATVIVRIDIVQHINPKGEWLYATSNLALWSIIEPTIGIACCAAATFRPLFKSLHDRSCSSARSAGYGGSALPNPTRSGHGTANGNGTTNWRGGVRMELDGSTPKTAGSRGSKHGFSIAGPYGSSFGGIEEQKNISLESLATRGAGGGAEGERADREREREGSLRAIFCETTINSSSQQNITEIV